MIQTVNSYDFHRAFEQMRPDSFSYKGLNSLFEYLEDLEDDTGENVELDVIAICCDFTEYENLKELQDNYTDIKNMEDLEDNTTVIMIDGDSFIIQDY